VLAFTGVAARPQDIGRAVAAARDGDSRLNVGVRGRGAGLQPRALHAVLELLDFYPEAANDPYIAALRSQAQTALRGGAPLATPTRAPARPRRRFAGVRRWWARNSRRVVIRVAAPIALSALAIGYWLWPADLIPDAQALGRYDDVVCLVAFCLVAGRLTGHRPHAAFLKRRMGD